MTLAVRSHVQRPAADEIAALVGADSLLVELVSGASRKVRLLPEALRPRRYLGVDISRDFLLASRRAQAIRLGSRTFPLARGETLHTENSCKYRLADFQALARRAGGGLDRPTGLVQRAQFDHPLTTR